MLPIADFELMDLNDRIRRGKGAKAQTALGMLGPTHDFQLRRVLLKLGPDVIVTGTRQGRSVVYSLYDNHVAQLLDEAVYHAEHLRLGAPDRTADTG